MVDEALTYFEMMQKEYRIKPVMDHFELLVDMFVMSDRLDEALDLIKKMEYEPNEFIWLALITGARIHGNPELGLYAAEQLIKLEPRDTETWVSLLRMYGAAERRMDMSNVEKLMREDQSCPGNNNLGMRILLEDLLGQIKTLGYEFLGSSELMDNEDANVSSRIHQIEESALAFGLSNTPTVAWEKCQKNPKSISVESI